MIVYKFWTYKILSIMGLISLLKIWNLISIYCKSNALSEFWIGFRTQFQYYKSLIYIWLWDMQPRVNIYVILVLIIFIGRGGKERELKLSDSPQNPFQAFRFPQESKFQIYPPPPPAEILSTRMHRARSSKISIDTKLGQIPLYGTKKILKRNWNR